MELKTKYQYTYFIHTFLINKNRYNRYITKLLKDGRFNLKIFHEDSGKVFSVESAFQGSKVFENGGPFVDLLNKTSREAKQDDRIRNSGKLTSFTFFDETFPLEPKTYFYDWLYINALNSNADIKNKILLMQRYIF